MEELISGHPMWTLILVMLSAGIVGGAVNHFLAMETGATQSVRRFMGRDLLVGLAASFMVPLFLNMISSDLVDLIRGTKDSAAQPYKILVFAGFCLIAAISSRAFIRTLSDQVLNEVKETRKEARAAKEQAQQATEKVQEVKENVQEVHAEIGPIVSRQTEDEPTAEGSPALTRFNEIDENERKILKAMADSKFALRTLSGIAREVDIDSAELEGLHVGLLAKNMVGKRMGKKGIRWYITQGGLDALQQRKAGLGDDGF
jgi:hypothetical protein